MDRKQFLRTCSGALCGCVAAYSLSPAEAASQTPGSEKSSFVNQRYAKLLDLVRSRMGERGLADCLHELGGFCSSTFDSTLQKYAGDVDGFMRALAATKTPGKSVNVTYDRAARVVTMITDYGGECPCALNSTTAQTPPVVCNCSLGWHARTWKTILQKDVHVEMVETALRGGKRCVFRMHVAA